MLEDILKTIGAASCEEIDTSTNWSMWKATFNTPVESVIGYFLYLKTTCPRKEADSINKQRWSKTSNGKYSIIISDHHTFKKNRALVQREFEGKDIQTTTELLERALRSTFELRPQATDNYFQAPDLYDPISQAQIKDALAHFERWFLSADGNANSISVLLADGGIGKTTFARSLAERLTRSKRPIIPLLIESELWKTSIHAKLDIGSVVEMALARTIQNPSNILSNTRAFNTLMRAGMILIIFDGFDELCGNPNFAESPIDIINRYLSDIEEATDDESHHIRILLTSRDSYWESIKGDIPKEDVKLYKLLGFSAQQRKEYLQKRLGDNPEKLDIANRIASEVAGALYPSAIKPTQNQDRISGTPFILDLVAEAVKQGDLTEAYSVDPLGDIIHAICKRENIRQNLNIAPETQIEILAELFRDFPGNIPQSELRTYTTAIAAVNDEAVYARFSNHFLLRRPASGTLLARYEILRIYFIARFLSQSLLDRKTATNAVSFTRILASLDEPESQITEWVANKLTAHGEKNLNEAFNHALTLIDSRESASNKTRALFSLTTIALKICEGKPNKSERTQGVLNLLSRQTEKQNTLRDLCFTGEIRSLDLSRITLRLCHLKDATFRNCIFSSESKFIECSFEGGFKFINCENESAISLEHSRNISNSAELEFARINKRQPRSDVMKNFAEEAVAKALYKFKGKFGFQSVKWANRLKGMPRENPFSNNVWDALLNEGVIAKHQISNVQDGGINIINSTETHSEIQSYFDNATIRGKLAKAVENLIKHS